MEIKDLRNKLLNTVSEIDVTKLTLQDLNILANIVKTISETHDDPDYLNKAIEAIHVSRNNVAKISDLKE